MSIVAMKVISAAPHPEADALRVYQFESASGEAIQIVANLSHVYEVDDVVAVVQVGTFFEGTKIKKTKLRKVESFGMAVGKVAVPVGSDVSHLFATEPKAAE